jgi:hypothetical protein
MSTFGMTANSDVKKRDWNDVVKRKAGDLLIL